MILHTDVRKFLTFSFPEFIIRHSTLIWLMVAVSVLTDNWFSWHSIDLHLSCWISIDQLQTEVQPNHRTNPIIVIAIERIWTFPGYQNVSKALIVVSALQIVRIIYTLIDEFHLGGKRLWLFGWKKECKWRSAQCFFKLFILCSILPMQALWLCNYATSLPRLLPS